MTFEWKERGGRKRSPQDMLFFFCLFFSRAVNSFMVTEELAARAPHSSKEGGTSQLFDHSITFTPVRQLATVRQTKGNPPPSPSRCVKPNKGSAQTSSELKEAALLIDGRSTPALPPPQASQLTLTSSFLRKQEQKVKKTISSQ